MPEPIQPVGDPWPGEMTPRTRFVGQMHHRPVDRCFNMEFGYWKENFQAWPIFRDHGVTDNARAHQLFGFDPIHNVGGNVWLHPYFEQTIVQRRGDHNVIRNAEGLLAEVPADGHASIPHFIESSVQTPADWEQVKARRLDVDDPAREVDVAALIRQHPPERTYPLGVACGSMIGKIRDLLTFEGLAYACHDYPEMVEDMVETCCRLVERFLDQVLGRVDFDFACGWEDICFRSGPLVSLGFFEQVVVPRYRRIGRKLSEAGIDIWYTDCDGDVRPLIDGFLTAGLNTLFPFEVNGSGHPGPVLDAHGPELRILGGVDKMQLGSGRDAIQTYLESIAPWVRRGGFIPFCDHRCPPNVPQDDYLYYLDLKRQLFCRPIG
jgi:uroporphyrinogen decarboxylase